MSARGVVGGILALGAGVLAYASLIERNAFTVRRESVDVLEPGSSPIRVLHLSDLHLAPWQHGKSRWIRSLRQLDPDLIVVTGDAVGHVDAIPLLDATLQEFSGIPGVFVHGSNDYFAPRIPNPFTYLWRPSTPDEEGDPIDTDSLDAAYRALGWVGLDNAAVPMVINGSTILFVGTDDPHLRRDRLDEVASELDELIDGLSVAFGSIVGVTHAPYRRVLDAFTTLGADVTFAGHTHGGQVCVPGFGALTTNSDLPLHFARGLGVWNHDGRSSFLNVSAGIGTSIFAPVRFACPPEAVLLTLQPRDIGYA